ncbi:MAG: nitroreductase family protein [Anaerolineae bacterium]|nr:nitroreductase family protein [Anaerolineae bacterium]
MFYDLVLKNRSYRRFYEDVAISMETLRELVNLARLTPSARNMQPLKYVLCCDRETNAAIFSTLAWAGYLTDWPGPVEGERPSAYIVVLGDKALSQSFGVDPGIAMQTILLGATERGLGGCMLGSIQREKLRQILNIPEQYEILNVVALGKPKETVVIDPVGPDGNIKYWRDQNQVHHVPKRSLDELIIQERG